MPSTSVPQVVPPAVAVAPATTPSPPGEHGFRPDIQGLRAVAVSAVVLYHAGVPGLPGGFVGVDVFFVISGFLITGMLWREVATTGTVALARFYGARARRLLPAGTLVLAVTALAALWLLPPLQVRPVLRDGLASALYAGNYRLAARGTDYLAENDAPSAFQHYWSLGVEEQFYLVWPALLVLGALLVRRWSASGRRSAPARSRSVLPHALVLSVVALLSFGVCLAWTVARPSWAFFSLPSRAWELALGGLVALTAGAWRRLPAPVAAAAGWAGLVLLLGSCVRLGATTPYPGVAALAPVVGTALVIGAGCGRPRTALGRVLSVAPARAVGRYSYSWYLWHWPLLVLAPIYAGHALGLAGRLGVAALSGLLAMATAHAVEDPVRFAGPVRRSAQWSLALGGAATALGVAVSLVALSLVPPAVGRGAAVAAPRLDAVQPAPPTSPWQVVDPADRLTAAVQQALVTSQDVDQVPSNLSPALSAIGPDLAAPFTNGCLRGLTDRRQPPCVSGRSDSPTRVALLGDSHAAMWFPALDRLAQQRQWRLETMTKSGCPVLDIAVVNPALHRRYTECEDWRAGVLDRLRAERPALVVLAQSRSYRESVFGFDTYGPDWLHGLHDLVAQVRAAGSQVLVLGPVPIPGRFVPACLSEHLEEATACTQVRATSVDAAGIAAERRATEEAGGGYADLADLFCTPTRCPAVVGNQLVYRDDSHITVEYAGFLTPVVSAYVSRLPGLAGAG